MRDNSQYSIHSGSHGFCHSDIQKASHHRMALALHIHHMMMAAAGAVSHMIHGGNGMAHPTAPQSIAYTTPILDKTWVGTPSPEVEPDLASTEVAPEASTEVASPASREVATAASTEVASPASREVATAVSTEVATAASTEVASPASREVVTAASTEVATAASTEVLSRYS